MKRNYSQDSWNQPTRSTEPSNPVEGDTYLDNGTNTSSNLVSPRRYNGTRWIDLSARTPNVQKIINSVDDLPTPEDLSDGLGTAYRLETGHYVIGDSLELAYPIAPTATTLNVALDFRFGSSFTYTGSGALFRANATNNFGEFMIRDAVLVGDTTNTLFDITGDGNQSIYFVFSIADDFITLGTIENMLWISFKESNLAGFTTGLTIDECEVVLLTNSLDFRPASGLNGACLTIDGTAAQDSVSASSTNFFLLNSNQSALDIKSTYTGYFSYVNSLIDTSLSGTPFAASSLDQTTLKINIHNVRGVSDSQMIGSFYMERNTNDTAITNTGETGSFTSVADAGGGQVTITSVAHGLINNDVVWIIDDEYTGKYTIVYVDVDSFKITATYTGTTSGTWETHWVKIEGTTLSLENERASMTGNNELTFVNLESQAVTISLTIDSNNDGVAAAKNWEFAVMQNSIRLKGSLVTRQMTNIIVNSMAISATPVLSGDVFEVYVRNMSDTTDCVVANMTLIVRGN